MKISGPPSASADANPTGAWSRRLASPWARAAATALLLMMVAGLGELDYRTGPEISFSLFYLVPIAAAAWFISAQAGVVIVLASTAFWLAAELLGREHSHASITVWNAFVRLIIFLACSLMLSNLRARKQNLEATVAERTASLRNEVEERRRAQQLLLESERWYRSVVESAGPAIICLAPDLRILEWNRAAERLFSCTREQVIGEQYAQRFGTPHSPGLIAEQIARQVTSEPAREYQDVVRTADGVERTILWNAAWVLDEDGRQYGIIAVGQDITERRRARKRVRRYQARLRSLASSLSLAEERERRRLAIDLHDSLSQILNLSKITLDKLCRGLSTPERDEPLRRLRDLIEQAEQSARHLTFELSPPVLYDLGFAAALDWLADNIRERYGLAVELQPSGRDVQVNERLRVILFRSVQELLVNVAKHARATKAVIRVTWHERVARITVEDDGVGFDVAAARSRAATGAAGGFGLFSIRERLRPLGGQVNLRSQPGQGTTVTLEAPLAADASPGPAAAADADASAAIRAADAAPDTPASRSAI